MRALAREAGLSVTTLYNLFGAREEIVAALVDDAIDHMDEALVREAPLDDPIERCRAVVTVSIRSIHEDEAMFRPLMSANSRELSPARGRSRHVSRRAAGMQAVAIEEAMSMGLLKPLVDPLALGRQIYHGWEHAFFQWLSGRLDVAGFEARALYGLYIALLGIANESVRPGIELELGRLEALLTSTSPSKTAATSALTRGERVR